MSDYSFFFVQFFGHRFELFEQNFQFDRSAVVPPAAATALSVAQFSTFFL